MTQEQLYIALFSGTMAAAVIAIYMVSRSYIARRHAWRELFKNPPEETLDIALPLPDARNVSERIDRRFAQLVLGTGLELGVAQAVGIILFCGVAAGTGLYLWRSELWIALFGFVLGLALPLGYLLAIAGRRRRAMHQQMPDAIFLLSRSLRAGLGLEQGFQLMATESSQPLSDELRRVSDQVKLGLAVPVALQTAAQRVSVVDFSVFAAIIALHRNTGGQLPLLLDRLANGIRDRVQYTGQFRAATAMGRVSAIALGTAVPLIFLWYVLFQPETVQIFLETPGGLAMLGTAFGLEIIGVIWLYRLLRTED